MTGQEQHILVTTRKTVLTDDERIDLVLSRAYAVLLRAAEKARAGQLRDQEQQKPEGN
jgi:hypothetical protein